MAAAVGNIAAASTSSTSLKGGFVRPRLPLSSSLIEKGTWQSVSSSSDRFGRVSWQGVCRREAPRPDSRVGISRRNVKASELYIQDSAAAIDELPLGNGTVHQLHGIEVETPTFDENPNSVLAAEFELLLKEKADQVGQELRGTCIFLIGMMGSGKTTVGKILSEALGYYFCDSDELIEHASGGMPVAQIFRERHEEGFRELETEVLSQLSSMGCLVVATGGGAVVRPHNWGYLRHGITVWLNVPLDALAKRVTAVGTESRPLLGCDCAYHQALARLSKLFEERGAAYANADATVSLADLALRLGCKDTSGLTPTMIAVQVLEEIRQLLRQKKYVRPIVGY